MSEHGPTEDESHSHEWLVFQQIEPDIAEFLTQRWGELEATGPSAYIMADIAAKRRIIERWYLLSMTDSGQRIEFRTLDYVLCLLAAPFNEHPDFRSEWGEA